MTTILEKIILNGWGSYKVFNNAYGSFFKLDVPKNSVLVVTQIIYNHFQNPIKNYAQTLKWGEFFKYNEYQVKIANEGNQVFYQFRNTINWHNDPVNNPIVLDANINKALFDKYFIQEPNPNPIILPTYITAKKFIEITVTRNAYFNTMVGTYNVMNREANQQVAPNGLQDSNVILDLAMTTLKGSAMNYVPPSYPNANISAPTARQFDNYIQDISVADANSFESNLQNLNTGDANSTATNPTTNFPLISLGVVVINMDFWDKIQS